MRHAYLLMTLLLALSACGPVIPVSTATPTPQPLIGTVDIHTPLTGSIVFAETLFVAGTAQNLPSEGFRLVVMAESDTLASVVIQPQGETWQAEIVHEQGETPQEVTLIAVSAQAGIVGEYDSATTVIAPLSLRTSGVYGAILQPTAQSVAGGDAFPVLGTFSGMAETTLTLTLMQAGLTISQTSIPIAHANGIDELAWVDSISSEGKTGPAELVLTVVDGGQTLELDRVDVMLGVAAG